MFSARGSKKLIWVNIWEFVCVTMLDINKFMVLHSRVFVWLHNTSQTQPTKIYFHQTAAALKSTPGHSFIHHKNCNTRMMHLPLQEEKKTDSTNYKHTLNIELYLLCDDDDISRVVNSWRQNASGKLIK